MTATSIPAAFVAWRRLPGGRWHRLAEGATLGDAWRAALNAGAEHGGSGETVVLPASRHPDDRAATTAGRPGARR